MKYIIGIDQSTQGTKALLFDSFGTLLVRSDLPHRQIVNDKGWVEHDPEEFYANTIQTVKNTVGKAGIDKNDIIGVGISNQRETSVAWTRDGKPVCNAIVWQCARAEEICRRVKEKTVDGIPADDYVKASTGIPISPYFPAGKIAWVLENVPGTRILADEGKLCYGTVDSYLVYRLTCGKNYRTDYSNASRTQLFNLKTLRWDSKICRLFGIPENNLPQVTDSDGFFGKTDFEGFLDHKVSIHGVIGDSHGAMFGQGCTEPGMVKATYGTGSSVMMNVGKEPAVSKNGLISSIAWSMDGKVSYALEGNINYSGAVITWLKDNLHLIESPGETEMFADAANPEDRSYLVPAFTGLGSPWWDSGARAQITNMSRTTGRNEIVRDALDCIAYQIRDILDAMEEDADMKIRELKADGGATKNGYLMKFQSGILGIPVYAANDEELSGIGAAYAAGIGLGIYRTDIVDSRRRTVFLPEINKEQRIALIKGWKHAVEAVLKY